MNHETASDDLIKLLRQKIEAHSLGAIPFHDYMEACLYHETYGYYRSAKPKIGKDGDFYTSSSIGSIMGEMIGNYMVSSLLEGEASMPIHLVEWGGGNGRLALHILDEIQSSNVALYNRITYTAIESSSFHRDLQLETLRQHKDRIQFMKEEDWLANGEKRGTIVIANELLDAFPVHRVLCKREKLYENYVGWHRADEIFVEKWFPLSDERIIRYIADEGIHLAEGQIAEVNLEAKEWVRQIAECLDGGQLILIDYGDIAEEIYAPHRMNGTLMCYRKHQAHDDPFSYPGLQDLTAHVNFSACIKAGRDGGVKKAELLTQKEFLIRQGILERLQDVAGGDPFSQAARKNRAVRQLLLSDGMSELFKVLIMIKR